MYIRVFVCLPVCVCERVICVPIGGRVTVNGCKKLNCNAFKGIIVLIYMGKFIRYAQMRKPNPNNPNKNMATGPVRSWQIKT